MLNDQIRKETTGRLNVAMRETDKLLRVFDDDRDGIMFWMTASPVVVGTDLQQVLDVNE